MDVEYFPFDEQTCVMKFGSWTYDGFQVWWNSFSQKIFFSSLVIFDANLLKRKILETWQVNFCPWQYCTVQFAIMKISFKMLQSEKNTLSSFFYLRSTCGTRTRTGTWWRSTPRLRRLGRPPSSTSVSTSPSSTCQWSGTSFRFNIVMEQTRQTILGSVYPIGYALRFRERVEKSGGAWQKAFGTWKISWEKLLWMMKKDNFELDKDCDF